jgi:hypothetical protein
MMAESSDKTEAAPPIKVGFRGEDSLGRSVIAEMVSVEPDGGER